MWAVAAVMSQGEAVRSAVEVGPAPLPATAASLATGSTAGAAGGFNSTDCCRYNDFVHRHHSLSDWHPCRAQRKEAGCWSVCRPIRCAVYGVLAGAGSAPSSSALLAHQALGHSSAAGGPVQAAGGGPASASTLLGAAIAELGTALLGWQDE